MQLDGAEASESILGVLDRICATAADVCDSQVAILTYNRDGKTRILASHGIDHRFRVFPVDLATAPYDRTQFVARYKAGSGTFYKRLGAALGIGACEFFVRAPVSVSDAHTVSLIACGATPPKRLTAARLMAMREAAMLCHDQLLPYLPLLDDDSRHVSVLTTSQEVARNVSESADMVGLVDDQLKIRALSAPLAQLIGRPAGELIGRGVTEIGIHSGDAAAFLFRQAIDTGISPPAYEVIKSHPELGPQVFIAHATPFSPTDTQQYFVYFTVRDVTSFSRREEMLNRRFRASPEEARGYEEPSMRFLLDTLVHRRTLRDRNGVSYLTFQTWRHSIRNYQIAALKALKQNVPQELSHAVAQRVAGDINRLVGLTAFKFIVPMPCSNSSQGSCLSLEIARSLGLLTGLPVLPCLSLPPGGGASHPKKNARRPRMTLVQQINAPALLVDDVATSGSHMEEATKLLRPGCGAVLAEAWIGA